MRTAANKTGRLSAACNALELLCVGDDQVVINLKDLSVDFHVAGDGIVVDVIAKVLRHLCRFFDEIVGVIAGSTFEEANIFVTILHFVNDAG